MLSLFAILILLFALILLMVPLKGTIYIYDVLIQDIKHLLHQINMTVPHTLRERNQCSDFMTKLEASSDVDLLLHESPPDGLVNLL